MVDGKAYPSSNIIFKQRHSYTDSSTRIIKPVQCIETTQES